ncbi:MAG: hypothetical protein CO028_03890 [Candidatus Levybacteria bacterium CG_4_9_14_0_2_um_filter_35_21]|nr:MAG: hypothetical protein COW87_03820 [Candidatus Levybacteria bacterium CG22_combo_CG10-13_8_21_14_all_35_11]PJC54162.1 MAG: hypothetical protein CO028_03890 [Candidatus Levybacteria bacterium CG_4_9_14_0_2_um_filter_35_21]
MPKNKKSPLTSNNPYNLYNFVARALTSPLAVRKLIIIFSSFPVSFSPIFTGKKLFSQARKNYRIKSFQFLIFNFKFLINFK